MAGEALAPGCPKCGYLRKPSDSAPEWQCPSCGVAIDKYRAWQQTAQRIEASAVVLPARMPFPRRLAAATPDLISAATFLWCWLDPGAWRRTLASELGVVMLMEFFAVHSGAFVTAASGAGPSNRRARAIAVLLIAAFYLPVAGAFAWFHGGLWPMLAFYWLMLSQLAGVVLDDDPGDFARERQRFYWANSGGIYFLAAFAVLLLPVPELGLADERLHAWDAWWAIPVEKVIAWGFLFFGATALMRLLERPEWIAHSR